jgi:hypothetical protein
MYDESLDQFEQQLAAGAPGAPAAFREAVMTGVRRELRAARWDRRLARTAAATFVLGVGMNAVVGWRAERSAHAFFGGDHGGAVAQDSLVQAAAAVAEATDAETGRRVVRQLAALGGQTLSDEQAAAIDAAVGDHEG